jgi:uncharacterized protein
MPSKPLAVIDTNILVRALLKPDNADGDVFRLFLQGKIDLYYSRNLIRKLNRVLTYPRLYKKYHLTDAHIEKFLRTISTYGKLVNPLQKVTLCRDPDDDEILSIAISIAQGQPVYVITSDTDLLVLRGKLENVTILSPQQFLSENL